VYQNSVIRLKAVKGIGSRDGYRRHIISQGRKKTENRPKKTVASGRTSGFTQTTVANPSAAWARDAETKPKGWGRQAQYAGMEKNGGHFARTVWKPYTRGNHE